MNKNVRIAKELVKLAKSLVSKSNYLFPDMHDVEVNYCSMSPCFDRMSFESDYERIGNYKDNGIYLYDNLQGKKPVDVFDMSKLNEEWVDFYGERWDQFFSETSRNLNNTVMEVPLKQEYGYVIARGDSQSDWTQVIYEKSQVQNPQKFFNDFFYGYQLDLSVTIDGEEFNGYDILDDISDYSKQKVIDALKSKLGANFSDDVKSQLEKLLPEDNQIDYNYE